MLFFCEIRRLRFLTPTSFWPFRSLRPLRETFGEISNEFRQIAVKLQLHDPLN